MNVNDLLSSGFVLFDYPASLRPTVDEAMESWKGFCALSVEEKLELSSGERLRDFGYMRRQDIGPRADSKEMFHVSLSNLDALQQKSFGIMDDRALAFMDAAHALLRGVGPVVRRFARDVEQNYQLDGFESEVMESQQNWVFRYLHYSGGETLAHAHADRGGFTLHLHESHPGGEYYGFDQQWHPWPVSDKQTIIFPSMGLQYRSRGVLKALWHRVVPTSETLNGGRYSMVAFIDFPMGCRYNDAAKRLQDFLPGFNYNMPLAEFEKLFIPAESQTV